MRVEARISRVIASNGAAFVLAAALLFMLLHPRLVLSPLAFWLLTAVSAAVLGGEVLLWAHRGVRAVEAGPEGITLYRGSRLREERIERGQVIRMVITRRMGRRRAVLGLRPRERTLLSLTVRLPRRVVLSDDAFPPEGFAALLAELESLRPEKRE